MAIRRECFVLLVLWIVCSDVCSEVNSRFRNDSSKPLTLDVKGRLPSNIDRLRSFPVSKQTRKPAVFASKVTRTTMRPVHQILGINSTRVFAGKDTKLITGSTGSSKLFQGRVLTGLKEPERVMVVFGRSEKSVSNDTVMRRVGDAVQDPSSYSVYVYDASQDKIKDKQLGNVVKPSKELLPPIQGSEKQEDQSKMYYYSGHSNVMYQNIQSQRLKNPLSFSSLHIGESTQNQLTYEQQQSKTKSGIQAYQDNPNQTEDINNEEPSYPDYTSGRYSFESRKGYTYYQPSNQPTPGYSYPKPQQDTSQSSTGYSYPKPQQDTSQPSSGYSYPKPQQDPSQISTGYFYPKPQQDTPQPSSGYSYPKPQQDTSQSSSGYSYLKPQQDTSQPSSGYSYPKPQQDPSQLSTGYSYPKPQQDTSQPSSGYSYPKPQQDENIKTPSNSYLPPSESDLWQPVSESSPTKQDFAQDPDYLPPKEQLPLDDYLKPSYGPGTLSEHTTLSDFQITTQNPLKDQPSLTYIPVTSEQPALQDDLPFSYIPPQEKPSQLYEEPPKNTIQGGQYLPPPEQDSTYLPPAPPQKYIPVQRPLTMYLEPPDTKPLQDTTPNPGVAQPSKEYLPSGDDDSKGAKARHLSGTTVAGSMDENGFRVTDMSCLRTTSRARFTATITSSSVITWPPVLEGMTNSAGSAVTAPGCKVLADPADPHHRFLVDLSNSDLTRCGVKGCSTDGEGRLCVRLVVPSLPGIRLAGDPVLVLQCNLQPATSSLVQHFRISAAQSPSGRAASAVHRGGDRASLHANVQLLQRDATGQFSKPMKSGAAAYLGEDLQLRAVVRKGDGWQSSRLADVVVRNVASTDSVHLVGSDGCSNPDMKAVCPRTQSWPSGESLITHLPMKVFMFRGMRDGEQLLVTARVVACLDRADCKVEARVCDSKVHRRNKRSAQVSSDFEETLSFRVVVRHSNDSSQAWLYEIASRSATAPVVVSLVLFILLLLIAVTGASKF